jgi:diaminopropionate ammonia-lyase
MMRARLSGCCLLMPNSFVPIEKHAPVNLFDERDLALQRAFFAERPALSPTPLRDCPALARHLGIGRLLVKDETARFGLNAFKAAGAIFAVTTLRQRGEVRTGDTIVCASEGNHGRAVARAAREAECAARVYMSNRVSRARVEAIESEGAQVVLVDGTYDDAVRMMAREAEAHGWVIVSDTSWPGYTEIPRLIRLGYTRIMDEIDADGAAFDAIFVPAGVGGLLAAVACWGDLRHGGARPHVVAVEPLSATCVQTSIRAGRPTSVPGPFDTEMGGLRCGEMSPSVFPAVESLVDAFVGIEDDFAFEAMRLLARPAAPDPAIACGPSGAAALGGLLATIAHPSLAGTKARLGLGPDSRIVVLASEGITDATVFREVLARH